MTALLPHGTHVRLLVGLFFLISFSSVPAVEVLEIDFSPSCSLGSPTSLSCPSLAVAYPVSQRGMTVTRGVSPLLGDLSGCVFSACPVS